LLETDEVMNFLLDEEVVFVYVLGLLNKLVVDLFNLFVVFVSELLHLTILPPLVDAEDLIELLLKEWLDVLCPLRLIEKVVIGVCWINPLIDVKLVNRLIRSL
jgi:hypothetical protein